MVPLAPNQVWSADFMSDALYGGTRFRTFNVLDDFNREISWSELCNPDEKEWGCSHVIEIFKDSKNIKRRL
jgi:transposase InsO family protein